MTLQTFAQQHRLKISRDECNDEVIKGRRGHLYFDGPELCLMILDGPLRARSVLKAIGGKLWTGDKSAGELHLYRGAPAVRCWSKYQQTDKGISLCSAPLRKDSKGRSVATEDPTKVSCPYCVELMHPQACSLAVVPCGFCTGIITKPRPGDTQDVKITGIPLENARLAIRLVGVRPPHVMSEARKKALDKARSFLPAPGRTRSQRQNSHPPASGGIKGHPGRETTLEV
jgi:hypothetical protein